MGSEEDITEKLALVQKLVNQSSPLDGKNLPVWLRKAIREHFCPMDRDPSLVTYSVTEAGHFLGLGRSSSYQAARTGQLPVLKIRGKFRVPRLALIRLLEEAGGTGKNRTNHKGG